MSRRNSHLQRVPDGAAMIEALKEGLPDGPPIGIPVPAGLIESLRAISARITESTAERNGILQAICAINDVPWVEVKGWNLVEDFHVLTVSGPKVQVEPAAPEPA